jgi:hypothetical protein
MAGQTGMGREESIFWIALTIFGTGLYLVIDDHQWGGLLLVVGVLGLIYSLRHELGSGSYRSWIVIVTMAIAVATAGYDIYQHSVGVPDIAHNSVSPEETEKAIAPIRAERDELRKELGEERTKTANLTAQLSDAQSQVNSAKEETEAYKKKNDSLRFGQDKSPLLRLDDAGRFQLVKALRDAMNNSPNGRAICHTMVHEKPASKWASEMWEEISSILNYSGWWLEGGRTAKTFFPPGLTLSTAKDTGDGFNCAFRLSEILLGLHIPTTVRDNQVSPDLVACEKENSTHGCVEIIVGDEH